MKSLLFFIFHSFLFYFLLLITLALQGAIWLQLFSEFPSPSLWITFLVFGAFYRNRTEAILLTYMTSLVAMPFVNMPFGLFLACNSLCMFTLLMIRSRFIISKPSYLSIMTLFITFLFPIIHFVISKFTELNPIQNFEFFSWLISSLLTAIFSVSLYQLYIWLDQLLQKKWPREVRAY